MQVETVESKFEPFPHDSEYICEGKQKAPSEELDPINDSRFTVFPHISLGGVI